MKCFSIIFFFIISPFLCEANWCIQNITLNLQVSKILSRTKTYKSWLHGVQHKTETYRVTEFVPRVKQLRTCCEGYVLDKLKRRCLPSCSEDCPRLSMCVRPNTCECLLGYELRDDRCEPICRPACDENSYCSGPDVCSCKFRFERNSSGVCEPWCRNDCKNGFCLAPGQCICNPRFVKRSDGICVPECRQNNCLFGYCSADHVCHCLEGYKYDESAMSCKPIDDENYETTTSSSDQTTVDWESTTNVPSSPNELLSTTNISNTTELTTSMETTPNELCFLHCAKEFCEDGVCECNEGFARANSSCKFNCQDCQMECVIKSLCQEDETVTTEHDSIGEESISSLMDEVTTNNAIDFQESCQNSCSSGECVDGTCQCWEGFVFVKETNNCAVFCKDKCQHGECTKNGDCKCLEGYGQNNGSACLPLCEPDCINSICVAPQQCECLDGLSYKPGSLFECSPVVTISEKLDKRLLGYCWFYGLLMMAFMATVGLFVFKALRKGSYNVGEKETRRQKVLFQNSEEPGCVI